MSVWAERLVFGALVGLFGLILFALGFLLGAGHGLDQVRQEAVDEGYAVRTEDGGIRWRSSEELRRR